MANTKSVLLNHFVCRVYPENFNQILVRHCVVIVILVNIVLVKMILVFLRIQQLVSIAPKEDFNQLQVRHHAFLVFPENLTVKRVYF
jgi:hypothetical protein